jgi:hypothetical protein
MKSILPRNVGVALALAIVGSAACSSTTTPMSDAGSDAGPTGVLPFQPSNVSLTGIDVSKVADADITGNCTIQTDGDTDCFPDTYATAQVVQSDGTKVDVIVVKSLRLEAAANLNVSGGIPLVLISLGDMTLLGTFDAGANTDTGNAGGFTQETSNAKGGGPGGGPGAVDSSPGYAAGGGSFCGLGGIGGTEPGATGTPAATAAYGTPDLRPLMAGSSGGMGAAGGAGAGGGAVQLVAGGTFMMNAGSYINVGGGGGNFGGTASQEAGGGGAGGSILIEATTVSIAGILAANGGGAGSCGTGSEDGSDGTPNSTAAAAGAGTSAGGAGSAGGTTAGSPGTVDTAGDCAGGGGGGAGRIRINSSTPATITAATFSPTVASSCAGTGTVRATGSGV